MCLYVRSKDMEAPWCVWHVLRVQVAIWAEYQVVTTAAETLLPYNYKDTILASSARTD